MKPELRFIKNKSDLGLAFISGVFLPDVYQAVPETAPTPGALAFGGIALPRAQRKMGTFTAIDVNTGARRWQKSVPTPVIGGALATAGGLVFYGEGASTNGALVALDAATGAELLRLPTAAGVNAAPMTFVAQGHQLITVAAGGNALALSKLGNLIITLEVAP